MHPDIQSILDRYNSAAQEAAEELAVAERRHGRATGNHRIALRVADAAQPIIDTLTQERGEARARIAELEAEVARLRDHGAARRARTAWLPPLGMKPTAEWVDIRLSDGTELYHLRAASVDWDSGEVTRWRPAAPRDETVERPHVEADTTAAGTAAVKPAGGSDD